MQKSLLKDRTNMQNLISRREALQLTGCGFGALAAQAMASQSTAASELDSHLAPRAKRIIFLFM